MAYHLIQKHGLQKLTPFRGRKHTKPLSYRIYFEFTKANPDKGTETEMEFVLIHQKKLLFTKAYPDKGTETHTNLLGMDDTKFTKANPV